MNQLQIFKNPKLPRHSKNRLWKGKRVFAGMETWS